MRAVLSTVGLCVIALLLPVLAVVHSPDIIESVHVDVSASANTSAVAMIQSYVSGGDTGLPSVLSADAKDHLSDVRNLVRVAEIVLVVAIAFVVVAWRPMFKEAAAALLILTGLFGLGFTAFFETSFMLFHEAFFASGTYVFPADSTLITLFPASFFQACSQIVLVGWLFVVVSYYSLSGIVNTG